MKLRIFNIVLLIILVSSLVTAQAQLSEPGYPIGLKNKLDYIEVPVLNIISINNEEKLRQLDTCKTCAEPYGFDKDYEFDFWNVAKLDIIQVGNEMFEVYRYRIHSDSAGGLHVKFADYSLGKNCKMYLYSPFDSLRVLGAYTENNNKSDKSFYSNRIHGGDMIIEINRPVNTAHLLKGNLFIKGFTYSYLRRNRFGLSLNCHENVICAPWYNEWCNQIRSVVKFLWEDVNEERWWCSGAVVNNLNNNFDPLILTAWHCTENGSDHANWMFWFNFQSITCDPSTNGNDLMTVNGVDVLADDHDNSGCPDITIIRLRQDIPLQYNVFYSGWNRRAWSSLPNDGRGIGIHHPAGDVKKISEGYRVNPLLSSCVKVNWTTGYTEGGSSGSPLFVTSKEIIGVLSWSWHEEDDCDDDANFFYSWLNKSWSTLSPFLAPSNEGALTHTGIDPISACQPIINLNNRLFPGNDWQIKNQITIQAAQQVNVANMTPTVIGNSEHGHFITQHNSDYIIRAGNRITILPGFKINAPDRIGSSGIYSSTFTFGNQNRVSLQIAPCTPFIDDCGFNHQNASVVQGTPKGSGWDVLNVSNAGAISMQGVNIYPNPVSHVLYITLSEEKQQGSFAIYNLMGCKVMEGGLNAGYNASDISELSAGLYLLHIKTPEGGLHYKLVKE